MVDDQSQALGGSKLDRKDTDLEETQLVYLEERFIKSQCWWLVFQAPIGPSLGLTPQTEYTDMNTQILAKKWIFEKLSKKWIFENNDNNLIN